jgi:hypothetical protein
MLAKELGYLVESVQTGFPDCEAMRQITPSMRRPVSVKPFFHFFFLLLCCLFFQIIPIEPSRLCRHPSIRTLC